MNATTKFYTGFVIALALLMGASFFAGRHFAKTPAPVAADPAHAVLKKCLAEAKRQVTQSAASPKERELAAALAVNACEKTAGAPYFTSTDFSDMTGPGAAASPK